MLPCLVILPGSDHLAIWKLRWLHLRLEKMPKTLHENQPGDTDIQQSFPMRSICPEYTHISSPHVWKETMRRTFCLCLSLTFSFKSQGPVINKPMERLLWEQLLGNLLIKWQLPMETRKFGKAQTSTELVISHCLFHPISQSCDLMLSSSWVHYIVKQTQDDSRQSTKGQICYESRISITCLIISCNPLASFWKPQELTGLIRQPTASRLPDCSSSAWDTNTWTSSDTEERCMLELRGPWLPVWFSSTGFYRKVLEVSVFEEQ